jgi:hypothetical protein
VETNIKKWCTYGAFHKDYPQHIGLLEKQQGNAGEIRYAENQIYPLQYWDMNYVCVFDSLEEGILFLIKNNQEESIQTVKDYLPFPTALKGIDWEELEKQI